MGMTATKLPPPTERGIKTGRRENPAIDGPRDQTVCFMLSAGEKLAVDRLGFCMQMTRSGVLAKIVDEFIVSTEVSKEGLEAEKRLLAYLGECRKAVKQRGAFAAKAVASLTQG